MSWCRLILLIFLIAAETVLAAPARVILLRHAEKPADESTTLRLASPAVRELRPDRRRADGANLSERPSQRRTRDHGIVYLGNPDLNVPDLKSSPAQRGDEQAEHVLTVQLLKPGAAQQAE